MEAAKRRTRPGNMSGSILRPCCARRANRRRAVAASASDVWDRNDWSRRGSSEHGRSFTTKQVSVLMLGAVFTHGERIRSHAQLLPWESDPLGCSSFLPRIQCGVPCQRVCSLPTPSLSPGFCFWPFSSRTFKRDRTYCAHAYAGQVGQPRSCEENVVM